LFLIFRSHGSTKQSNTWQLAKISSLSRLLNF